MRLTIIGLTLSGVLAVAGCSDSDAGGEAAGSGSSDDFCAEYEALDERFANDPEAAGDTDAVLDALDGLNPPGEIADDYAAVVEAARRLAELDPEDPDAVEEAQALSEEVADAQGRVSDYLDTECDIDTSAADTGGDASDSTTTPEG